MEQNTKLLSHKHHILLVEDNITEAERIVRYFTDKYGQKVSHIKTGEEAIDRLKNTLQEINFVLLDIQLNTSENGMNGIQTAQSIKNSPFITVPVLLITSFGNRYNAMIGKFELDWFSRYNSDYLEGLAQKVEEILNRPKQYITIKNATENVKIPKKNILYICTSTKNYIDIHYLDNDLQIRQTYLKMSLTDFIRTYQLENLLIQAHQSYYVNPEFVDRNSKYDKQLLLTIQHPISIPLSRNGAKNFM